jgi:chromosome segregation ATPase
MTQSEYTGTNIETLREEVSADGKDIGRLGEQQEGHQQDLESLQKRLEDLKGRKGMFADSDRNLMTSIESAINTREISVEDSKAQMNEVSNRMNEKLANLKQAIPKAQERVDRMEDLVSQLNHREVTVNINVEIQNQKEEIEETEEKSNQLLEAIKIAGNLAGAGAVTVNAIQGLMQALQSVGLFR